MDVGLHCRLNRPQGTRAYVATSGSDGVTNCRHGSVAVGSARQMAETSSFACKFSAIRSRGHRSLAG